MWNMEEWKIRLSAFLVFIFLLASILFSGFGSQSKYVCRSCGSSQNQGFVSAYIGTYEEPSEPSIEVNELKGKEKEEALRMLLKSKDYDTMLSIGSALGWKVQLDLAAAAELKKTYKRSDGAILHVSRELVVGVPFEARPTELVIAVFFLKPLQHAYLYKLDKSVNILFVLVHTIDGVIVAVPNEEVRTAISPSKISLEFRTSGSCPQCYYPCKRCSQIDWRRVAECFLCLTDCLECIYFLNPIRCITCFACLALTCPDTCIGGWYDDCCPCDWNTRYSYPECENCFP
ncbi:MAG: hypothetical protein QXI42_04550 [Thermoproteota archaeon]